MSDAKDVAEAQAYAALSQGISAATVFQDVPANFTGPLVVIGETSSTPLGCKNSGDARVKIEILCMVDAEERAPLLNLQGQIKTLLDDARMNPAGWELAFMFEEDSARLHENGVSYVGSSTFGVFALKA
jgi:hypothetical protein